MSNLCLEVTIVHALISVTRGNKVSHKSSLAVLCFVREGLACFAL